MSHELNHLANSFMNSQSTYRHFTHHDYISNSFLEFPHADNPIRLSPIVKYSALLPLDNINTINLYGWTLFQFHCGLFFLGIGYRSSAWAAFTGPTDLI